MVALGEALRCEVKRGKAAAVEVFGESFVEVGDVIAARFFEVEEFRKIERRDADVDVASGEECGEFAREEFGIAASKILLL